MAVAPRKDNGELASLLERVAMLLETQCANPFRVTAYRRAADTVRGYSDSVTDLFASRGMDGLEELPCVGHGIASLIREYARSGRISLLDRLSGAVATEEILATVPGLGPTLARRIHDTLGVETLEELECACYDGRLSALRGFGVRRIAAIRASLSAMLGGEARRFARSGAPRSRPSVAAVLSVDHEYRQRARSGDLVRITPKRFNPDGRAWLAILHTEREGWAFTALYSNSARAHSLGKTDDWVILHADRYGQHDQCTVVTGRRGDTARRIIRGRELECEIHYREPARSGGLGPVTGRVKCPSPRLPTQTSMPGDPSTLEDIG